MSKFSKSTGVAGTIATAITGALLVTMPAAPAYAQKGSRLCGYTAPGPGGSYVGMLYEARKARGDVNEVCKLATSQLKAKIDKHPDLKSLTWTRQIMQTCESIGGNFKSANSPVDMCEKMSASIKYHVTMTPSASGGETTYVKVNTN